MKWTTVFQKGALGIVTFVVAYLASNPEIITNLLPGNIASMTIGGVVAGLLVAFANWLKNRKKK